MLELTILPLIDRVIELVKKRGELNRELFNDFVQPGFQAFEVVHTDYIDSLTRYKARLADTHFKMDLNHPIFHDIELDSLKSSHLRTKLDDFKPADASEKLRPFLASVDFYLRGVSASGMRIDLLNKIALAQPMFREEVGEAIGTGDPEYHVLPPPDSDRPPLPTIVFADPLREAISDVFAGFDAPSEADRRQPLVIEGIGYTQSGPEENRRRMCGFVINTAMEHFQHSYSYVSQEYSKLRSQLLKPA